jgi:hypothetical protein
VVEQLFRKQPVASSNLAVGFHNINATVPHLNRESGTVAFSLDLVYSRSWLTLTLTRTASARGGLSAEHPPQFLGGHFLEPVVHGGVGVDDLAVL